MTMTLGDYRTRLQDFYGSTLSSDDAFYDRVINDSYLELAALADWWWLETNEILRFSCPVTALSCVCNAGTADMVVDPCDLSTAYKFGWLSSGNHTYRVNDVTASGTGVTLTIDANWIEASATYTCQVWNDMLSLSSTADMPIAMLCRNDPNHKLLRHVDPDELDAMGPDVSTRETEIADRFAIFRDPPYTSTDTRIRIWPPPDDVAEYVLRYRQVPATMTAATSTSLIPQKHERSLVSFALLKMAKITREDPDVVSMLETEYSKALARMFKDQSRKGGLLNRIKARGGVDAVPVNFRLINVEAGGI